MIRRHSPMQLGVLLLVSAVLAAACSSVSTEELADRYRIESGAGDATTANTLPAPDSTTDEPATAGPGQSTDGRAPRTTPLDVSWDDCVFDTTGLDVECGRIEIPSAADDVDPVQVSFARFNAEAPTDPDPVVYLHGGPGGAVLETADRLYGTLVAPFTATRDVIIYDQRGAGESSPLPVCTEAWDLDEAFFGVGTPHADLRDDYVDALAACAERVQRRSDIDLSDYNSAVHADDLVDLSRSLGYEQLNLYGVSYGSRLAQTVLRDHPEIVRSAIISGVYPVEENLVGSTPSAFEIAVRRVFDACFADDGCNGALPNPVETLEAWVAQLDAEPFEVELPLDERSSYTFALAGDDLLNILHGLLYTVDGAALIPDLLIDLEAGDTDRLRRLASDGIYDTADVAAYLTVQCREEVPFSTAGELENAAAIETIWDRINLPPGLLSDDMVRICAAWDSIGVAEPLENEAVSWDQPTLVMAGGIDPITPGDWGVELANRLPNAVLAYSPDRGHDADEGFCAVEIITAFIDDPLGDIDASCTLDNPLPYITSTNVEVYERNQIELTDSIFDIDPSEDVDWVDMQLPDWVADFYDDEEVYWRNLDIYDPTVIVVRSGPFDAGEILWYLSFEPNRDQFIETDVSDDVPAGWTRWVFKTTGMDIVTYISDGLPDMNVSVVAADYEIDELERTALIPMINSVARG